MGLFFLYFVKGFSAYRAEMMTFLVNIFNIRA